jgi:hypothetical protein
MASHSESLTSISRTTSKKDVKVRKSNFYFTVLEDLNAGLNPKQIAAKYSRSRQSVNFYTSVLQKQGHIRKVGYGTWEVTKSGHEARCKSVSLGYPITSVKTIEIWRFGYRYRITHDNPIPGLKEQVLKTGGHVSQGRVLGCWITKGKENLDVYGTVYKSNDLWSASMKAISEIATVTAFLKERCYVGLEPLHALKPDIIINDPEAKKIAEAINKEFGVLRSELIDVDGGSKTGSPEIEPHTFTAARNTLENLTRDRNGEITQKLDRIEKLQMGGLSTDNALANSMNMQAVGLQGIEKILGTLTEKVLTLEALKEGSAVKVEITEDTGIFEGLTPFTYEVHEYDLKPPARIVLERDTANALIMNRKAKIV